MTCKIDNLEIDSIPEWMKEIEKICQKQERKELSESRGEYDHTIELT